MITDTDRWWYMKMMILIRMICTWGKHVFFARRDRPPPCQKWPSSGSLLAVFCYAQSGSLLVLACFRCQFLCTFYNTFEDHFKIILKLFQIAPDTNWCLGTWTGPSKKPPKKRRALLFNGGGFFLIPPLCFGSHYFNENNQKWPGTNWGNKSKRDLRRQYLRRNLFPQID